MQTIALASIAVAALGSPQRAAGETLGGSLVVAWNTRGEATAMIGAFNADRPWSPIAAPIEVGPNPTLRFDNDRLYVPKSADDSIRVVDPHAWRVERIVGTGLGGTLVDVNTSKRGGAGDRTGGDRAEGKDAGPPAGPSPVRQRQRRVFRRRRH